MVAIEAEDLRARVFVCIPMASSRRMKGSARVGCGEFSKPGGKGGCIPSKLLREALLLCAVQRPRLPRGPEDRIPLHHPDGKVTRSTAPLGRVRDINRFCSCEHVGIVQRPVMSGLGDSRVAREGTEDNIRDFGVEPVGDVVYVS